MNKKDCEIGMYVGVMQNINPLARSRSRVKRVGKIIGIYDDYVNLLLFDSNLSDLSDLENLENVTIKRQMYRETFRFQEIFKIKKGIKYQ